MAWSIGEVELPVEAVDDDGDRRVPLDDPCCGERQPADEIITGRVLMLIGVDDPIVPIEHRIGFEQEMRNGHVDWMHLYGGVEYSFTHPRASDAGVRGIAYDNGAASHAWSAMTVLPEEFFA